MPKTGGLVDFMLRGDAAVKEKKRQADAESGGGGGGGEEMMMDVGEAESAKPSPIARAMPSATAPTAPVAAPVAAPPPTAPAKKRAKKAPAQATGAGSIMSYFSAAPKK